MWRFRFSVGLVCCLALLGLGGASAAAEGIQAQCGAESGRAFAAHQGIVTAENAGWYDDAIRGETIVRIDTDTGAVAVRFRDATGAWQDVTDQGGAATLFASNETPPSFMVVVTYPGTTIELLTVAELRGSEATLIHTVSRNMPTLTNARIMTASCLLSAF